MQVDLATANCIIIAPKRLKLRLSGSARKSQKRFRDTPKFNFQPFSFRSSRFNVQMGAQNGATTQFESPRRDIYIPRSRYRPPSPAWRAMSRHVYRYSRRLHRPHTSAQSTALCWSACRPVQNATLLPQLFPMFCSEPVLVN